MLVPTGKPETGTSMGSATPGYCSPEQWLGKAVTTRTDVYSLGLLLYKLLTGADPRASGPASPAVMLTEICETETPRPSATLIENGQKQQARLVKGDLDTIVHKATQKDPERRYSSVSALAEDLRRHLEARPIQARADSGWYNASSAGTGFPPRPRRWCWRP